MGNDQRGSGAGDGLQFGLYRLLGPRVQGRRRFIEDQDGRGLEQCAGDRVGPAPGLEVQRARITVQD